LSIIIRAQIRRFPWLTFFRVFAKHTLHTNLKLAKDTTAERVNDLNLHHQRGHLLRRRHTGILQHGQVPRDTTQGDTHLRWKQCWQFNFTSASTPSRPDRQIAQIDLGEQRAKLITAQRQHLTENHCSDPEPTPRVLHRVFLATDRVFYGGVPPSQAYSHAVADSFSDHHTQNSSQRRPLRSTAVPQSTHFLRP